MDITERKRMRGGQIERERERGGGRKRRISRVRG